MRHTPPRALCDPIGWEAGSGGDDWPIEAGCCQSGLWIKLAGFITVMAHCEEAKWVEWNVYSNIWKIIKTVVWIWAYICIYLFILIFVTCIFLRSRADDEGFSTYFQVLYLRDCIFSMSLKEIETCTTFLSPLYLKHTSLFTPYLSLTNQTWSFMCLAFLLRLNKLWCFYRESFFRPVTRSFFQGPIETFQGLPSMLW